MLVSTLTSLKIDKYTVNYRWSYLIPVKNSHSSSLVVSKIIFCKAAHVKLHVVSV